MVLRKRGRFAFAGGIEIVTEAGRNGAIIFGEQIRCEMGLILYSQNLELVIAFHGIMNGFQRFAFGQIHAIDHAAYTFFG